MKKIISIALTLVLVLSLATMAFAAEPAEPTDMTEVTVTKVYKLVGAGSNPAETFTLEQVGNGVVKSGDATSAPALGTITGAAFAAGAASAEGAEANITITLPSYTDVGVYEYTLKEVVGDTAGVTYYGNNIKLVVTVINGTDNNLRIAAVHTEAEGATKSDKFENTYSAGSLSVSKTVTGNLGDKDKYFAITIALTGVEGKDYTDNAISVGETSYSQNPTSVVVGTSATFYLKDGETITLGNIPYGVTYSVTEANLEDYTETVTDNDDGVIDAASQSVSVVNNKEGNVDTGIALDSVPFVIMLAVCAVAAVMFVTKRRSVEE